MEGMTPERKQRIINTLNHRQPGLTVLLENIEDPHNLAAILRTADSVGVQDIYILNTPLPQYRKFGKRSASGAMKWLTFHEFTQAADCIKAIRDQYDKIYTTHLGTNSSSLYELDLASERVALVFGNEHYGVSQALLAAADGNFIIPQMGMIQSLNVSVACAISLYEAFRQRTAKGLYVQPQLAADRWNNLAQQWSAKQPKEC